jgi:hypothetical protein
MSILSMRSRQRRAEPAAEAWQVREFATLDPDLARLWDDLLQERSVALRSPFWRALERGRLNDFRYRYLLLEHPTTGARAVAVAYAITTDIAIFAPRSLHRLLQGIRGVFPRFLLWQMLECGTPITLTSPPWQVLPEEQAPAAIDTLVRYLRVMARRDRHLLIILRDFESNAEAWRAPLARHGYHWIPSLPNTYLPISWPSPEAYQAAMRSYYRSKLQKYLKRNRAQGVTHYLERGFAPLAETLCRQWVEVHEHAKEFQREILTPDFYRALAEIPEIDAQVLLFHRDEKLVGHALLLRDGDMLRWLYVGREASVNDGLYLYIAYAVVETAILQGAKKLEMGLTTYAIKQDLGAAIEPVSMALRARFSWMNPFVGWGYRLLNRIPELHPRKVFKDQRDDG